MRRHRHSEHWWCKHGSISGQCSRHVHTLHTAATFVLSVGESFVRVRAAGATSRTCPKTMLSDIPFGRPLVHDLLGGLPPVLVLVK